MLVLVTVPAPYHGMRSSKWESGLFVVEECSLPSIDVVTEAALGLLCCSEELTKVDVLVTAIASRRSIVKDSSREAGGERRQTMTAVACHAAVSAGQNKASLRVIESVNVAPRLLVVAVLAAAVVELSLVRVLVAPRTG